MFTQTERRRRPVARSAPDRTRSARPKTRPAAGASARDEHDSLERVASCGRIALGLLWLIDGLLQFQPYMFAKTFITGVILPNAVGQPSFIGAPITWIAHLIEPHVVLFNAFAATLQVLIGVGLLYRRTAKPALLASFAWALGVWFSGEGLGMIFTGDASPLSGAPGAALLYVLVGALCWPRSLREDERQTRRAGRLGLIGERGARIAWAGLWLGSALLWLLPANDGANSVSQAITDVPSGAGWLTSILEDAASASAHNGSAIAIAMAGVSAAIGIAVLRRWNERAFLWLAIALSLLFWIVGQGFGGIFTGEATDVSTAPLIMLIAAILLALPGRRRPSGDARVLNAPDRPARGAGSRRAVTAAGRGSS
jgi:hypothetical protein